MKPVRIIIAGGRNFNDYERAFKSLDKITRRIPKEDIEVVEGGALGADRIGRRWAILRQIPYKTFEAEWGDLEAPGAIVRTSKAGKKYNAKAGIDRNHKMGEYSTHLVAFWDGKSSGTKDMINFAKKIGLNVRVIKY